MGEEKRGRGSLGLAFLAQMKVSCPSARLDGQGALPEKASEVKAKPIAEKANGNLALWEVGGRELR